VVSKLLNDGCMTDRRIANFSSTLVLALLAGCAADIETEGILGEAAADGDPFWQPLGTGCADTIGVAPNDVLWVTGCDGRPDNSVWYMRYEVECYEGICADVPVWYEGKGSGKRITVFKDGNVFVVTSGGAVHGATWQNKNGVAVPTGRWRQPIVAPDCVNQLAGYVADPGGLTFETPTRSSPDDGVWRYFSTACNADLNGNSRIRYLRGYHTQTPWLPANGSGQLLATFFGPVGSSPEVTLLTSGADGSLWSYDESGVQFSIMASPPGLTYSLTDHFAATDQGVFRYDDATGGWNYYIDGVTPTGRIKQIARAGAVRAVRADGSELTIGPSSLWGVDDSGQIYYAVSFRQPR
jgi:hypothetical protein